MESVLESKKTKYTTMTEEELLAEAERLSSHEDKTVAGFARTLKKCILNKFIDLNEFFTAVNVVLFTGGPVLAICIGAIIAAMLLLTTLVPFILLQGALKAQNDFLKTRLKWTDPNAVEYRELSKEIRNRHIRVTTEGIRIVTEAPKEEIVPEDTNDYTDNIDEDVENTPEEEPEEPTDDGGDEPAEDTEPVTTDYTEDEDLTTTDNGEDTTVTDLDPETTDDNAEDEPLDPNAEVGDTTTDETGEEDTAEDTGDDTADYTEDGDIADGETTDETDDTIDDTTGDMGGDGEQSQHSIVKNYNLMIDFKRLFTTTSDILSRLGDVVFKNPIQNQVLDRCIQNIQKISEQVLNYMEFSFSSKYEDNLYHYNIFVQALKLNLEIMKKNSQLGDIDENS